MSERTADTCDAHMRTYRDHLRRLNDRRAEGYNTPERSARCRRHPGAGSGGSCHACHQAASRGYSQLARPRFLAGDPPDKRRAFRNHALRIVPGISAFYLQPWRSGFTISTNQACPVYLFASPSLDCSHHWFCFFIQVTPRITDLDDPRFGSKTICAKASALGPSATSSDVRYWADVAGQADVRRATGHDEPFYGYTA